MMVILPKEDYNITEVETVMRRFEIKSIEEKLTAQNQYDEVEVQGPML
jgi:hypothetical protein